MKLMCMLLNTDTVISQAPWSGKERSRALWKSQVSLYALKYEFQAKQIMYDHGTGNDVQQIIQSFGMTPVSRPPPMMVEVPPVEMDLDLSDSAPAEPSVEWPTVVIPDECKGEERELLLLLLRHVFVSLLGILF